MEAITVTIAAGQSLSNASVSLPRDIIPIALETDAAWDTAKISLQALGDDGVTWKEVWAKDGTALYETGSVTANGYIPIDIGAIMDCKALKVRSGTAASAVNQTDATVVTIRTTDF